MDNYCKIKLDAYVNELGLNSLFNHCFYEYYLRKSFTTDNFIHPNGESVICKMTLIYHNDEIIIYVGYSSVFDYIPIEGSLIERRIKILEYFADNGFKPATALLRPYRIDNLLT